MKKDFTITTIVAIAAMLTAASCAKEENVINPSEEATLTTFTASVEAPDTKTSLDASNQVLWTSGDKIKLFYYTSGTTSGSEYTLSTGAGSTSGTFTGGPYDVVYPMYAYYPSENAISRTNSNISITLPPTQTYVANSIGNGVNPMVAKLESGTNFSFKNLCGVLELQLTGTQKVRSIIVYSASDILCGEGTIAFNGVNPEFTPAEGNTNHTVTLDCGAEGVQLSSEATPFYIVVPTGAFASGFTVGINTTDNAIMTKSSVNAANTIVRSQIKVMPSMPFTADTKVNLSSDQKANCYIASPFTSGSFFAGSKGNTDEIIGTPLSAQVLWETGSTVGGIISTCSLDTDTRVVSFTTAPTAGNAVIAVYDNADPASGNILWSWHIWVTDYSPTSDYDIYPNSTPNAGAVMMDRNLGAINNTPGDIGALGLLYQWGRKDPFIGIRDLISSTTEFATTAGTAWSKVATGEVTGTVEYATKHPQTFIAASDSPYDWHYASRDNSLWADATKSKYDPCPPGWKVPNGGNGVGVWYGWSTSNFTWDSTNGGRTYTAGTPSSIWYPAAGYRTNSDGKLWTTASDYGYYWSSAYAVSRAYGFLIQTGLVNPSTTAYRAYGCSVRCLRE